MLLYLFFTLFAVIALFWLMAIPARQRVAVLSDALPIIVILVGSLLTLLRRGVIGIPLFIIGVSWWRRNHSKRPISSDEGQKSTVRSAHLAMELDHDTGEMDGTVLTGHMQGVSLSSLSEQEIMSLYFDFRSDAESISLLESFLDRYYPDWRDHDDSDAFRNQKNTSGFDNMTRQEAYQILGIDSSASQEDIHQAWRRLIKGVHPDSGGSAFLSAKINAAKDILLD